MQCYFINVPNRRDTKRSNKMQLTREIQDLIREFQNESLPIESRECAFHKIINLTKQLMD